jgi:hypothetical protein
MRTPDRICLIAAALVMAGPSLAATAAKPRERSWFEQVERDRDRGAGRIVDEPTWESRRFQERRDVRLGRLRPRREFERLEEEQDRRLQIEALERRQSGGAAGAGDSVILSRPPGAGGVVMSPMAAQAAADERALEEAADKLRRSLRAVGVAEQRSLRALRRRLTLEGRAGEFGEQSAAVRERHERLRAGHRADYQRVRSRILGRP